MCLFGLVVKKLILNEIDHKIDYVRINFDRTRNYFYLLQFYHNFFTS